MKKERVKDNILNHFFATQNEGRLLKFDESKTSLTFWAPLCQIDEVFFK
jgi:hypothetical protein